MSFAAPSAVPRFASIPCAAPSNDAITSFNFFAAASRNSDLDACLGQRAGYSQTDAGRAGGYDRFLSLQLQVHMSNYYSASAKIFDVGTTSAESTLRVALCMIDFREPA